MTDIMCTGPRCDIPLSNGYTLCTDHTETLRTNLQAVPDVWANLQVTIRKQDATAANVGGSGPTGSKPAMNLDAWDKGETLDGIISGWGKILSAHKFPVGGSINYWCGYLQYNLSVIAHQDWAGDLYRELADSLHECRLVTDRATERINLGACGLGDCDGTVTAIVGASHGKCRTCKTTWDVKERQMRMISNAWHVTGFMPDIVNWLDKAGHAKLNVQKLKNWVHKGRLEAAGTKDGRPVYTPAAVMEAYRNTPTGKAEEKNLEKVSPRT